MLNDLFARIDRGELAGVTSVVTVAEVLVHPIRHGNAALADAYAAVLDSSAHMRIVPIDLPAARRAAGLRARFGLRTPDAFQIAAAIEAGCDAFLTNDTRLERVKDLRVVVLDSLSAA